MVFLAARLYTRRLISIATLAMMPKIIRTRRTRKMSVFTCPWSWRGDVELWSCPSWSTGRSFVYAASSTWDTEVTAASVDIIIQTPRCVRWMKNQTPQATFTTSYYFKLLTSNTLHKILLRMSSANQLHSPTASSTIQEPNYHVNTRTLNCYNYRVDSSSRSFTWIQRQSEIIKRHRLKLPNKYSTITR